MLALIVMAAAGVLAVAWWIVDTAPTVPEDWQIGFDPCELGRNLNPMDQG